MRFSLPLSLLGLAALIAFAVAGSAFAQQSKQAVRPDRPVSAAALRAVVDHYRTVTWTYERAAHVAPIATSYSYRRSTDPRYLEWTIDTWTRRADTARAEALARIHRRLHVQLPHAPRLRARLSARLAYIRRLTLQLRAIWPGSVTRSFASAREGSGQATYRLWQRRSALAALLVSRHGFARPPVPASLAGAFTCIHRYEGAWDSNTGNGYYGGLQMDIGFQRTYGGDYLRRWGTADNWPAWAQLDAAVRAYRAGRGFAPWPNTARACGLI